MDERLEGLLVCSVCRSSLTSERGGLQCAGCDRLFAISDDVPDLTPVPPPDPVVLERWPLWQELQRNGERMYVADPPSSLSVGVRKDVALFAEFADLQGVVLDIGCGPQSEPSYAEGFGGVFVGIDPLRGAGAARSFSFVQGIGEFLPFRAGTFDRVLFGTSLDHALSPELALREARRVVSSQGAVVVWLGRAHGASGDPRTLAGRRPPAPGRRSSGARQGRRQPGAIARRPTSERDSLRDTGGAGFTRSPERRCRPVSHRTPGSRNSRRVARGRRAAGARPSAAGRRQLLHPGNSGLSLVLARAPAAGFAFVGAS